ncbi:hypothetical protein HMPREF0201_02435 [Cedecea davisae DSM 4568]|uniref:Uncharacterized protein n=1 Tax=Cedecea davisae DSM 4568 TaxID=566551 RepID=S3JU98_9ENTR|nr:hypothetical protein HMPREF0201_02435 [Cedecea davisae DSM 4568]
MTRPAFVINSKMPIFFDSIPVGNCCCFPALIINLWIKSIYRSKD